MKKILILILLLTCSNQFIVSQSYKRDSIIKDLNNDKVTDTLVSFYESGSNFGGREVSIINGKTNEKFTLSNYGCFCDYKNLIRISDSLGLKKNKLFLDAIKKEILPAYKAKQPDATLQWMLSGQLSLKPLKNDSLFDLIASPKTKWQSHVLEIPKPYYIEISRDTLQKITPEEGKVAINESSKAFLSYYTGAHYINTPLDSIKPVTKNKKYKIYKTAHTVFVKKSKKFKWLFISDIDVTGAPGKLRWPSIKQISLIDKYLIIHQAVPPDNVYNIQIVNIETQRLARLKHDPAYNNWTDKGGLETFKLEDEYLIFSEYGKPELTKLSLKKIFSALDTFHTD